MFFLWPEFLWLLPAVALLPVLYAWLLRRKRKLAVRYSSIAVARAAAGRGWRRHVPPALFLLACAGLALAAARPVAEIPLPWARTTILLAMDVSLSMRITDVQPNRLVAAQEAAKSFLADLPKDVEVGLVTFAGSTQVAQRATLDRAALVAAIDGFQMQMGTAVGDAIIVSLGQLFPDQGFDLEAMTFGGRKVQGRSIDAEPRKPVAPPQPVKPGSYTSASIILLSDGRRTTGIDTLEAAKMAADRGVRIDVVGLGVVDGEASMPEGMPIYLRLDEPTLKEVARTTGGEYFHAGTAEKLKGVYENLGSRLQVQKRETELSALIALASAVLMVVGGALSVLWFGRIA